MISLYRPMVFVAMIAILVSGANAAANRTIGKHPTLVPKPPAGAWKTDFTSGVLALRGGERPTLLMVAISSDPACRKAKETIADQGVQQALKDWNLLYDDTDVYARFEKVLWYRTVPFFVMFDKDGNEISRCGDGMTAAEFAAWIGDIDAQNTIVEGADAVLEFKPGDMKTLRRKSDAMLHMALKMYNADIRFAVSMPERLERGIAVAKQAEASGDQSRDLKDEIEFAEAVVQALRGRLDPAAKRLADLRKTQPNSTLSQDAEFWRIYIAMVRNESNPIRNHDPESDEWFRQYHEKYPKSFYGDTARRRIDTIKAEIEKEKAQR